MDGPQLTYRVRRSARARRVRVLVHGDGGVEVVVPQRAPAAAAADAVRELRPWIERRVAAAQELLARTAPPAGTVTCAGETLWLTAEPGRTRVHRRGEHLLVPDGDPREALERWYRRQARAVIAPRVQVACAALGREHTALTIRNQRTRWGSCTSAGALSFNWRLLLAPVEVLDYVVWHEACHLVHLDHSPRFWGLVATHRPSYKEEQRWLARNGAGLVLPAPGQLSDEPPSARASAA